MINPLTEYGLFGWNYRYILLHPWVIGKESYYRTKWFIQRGWRGYSDRDTWDLYSYLSKWMPAALTRLQENKIGHPCRMTQKGWDSRIEKMKQGFLESTKIRELKYQTIPEIKAAERRMKRGLSVFVEHYLSLWD